MPELKAADLNPFADHLKFSACFLDFLPVVLLNRRGFHRSLEIRYEALHPAWLLSFRSELTTDC